MSIVTTLGIVFLPPEKDFVRATMPADDRTCQPFGLLSGGASLALAEAVAGYGSCLLCDKGELAVGIQVSASHLRTVPKGKTVTATGTVLHKGKTTHVWNVDIHDDMGRLISTARVTNQIIVQRTDECATGNGHEKRMEAAQGIQGNSV